MSKIEPEVIEYTPGEWFKAGTIEQMQQFYLHRLPAIREAAQEHGYAIGTHGSQRRDFDLMAMQWREDASDPATLAHAIAEAACGISREGAYQWEKKPMGRIAVSIPICWTDHANPDFKGLLSVGHIDLSVISVQQAVAEATAELGKRNQEILESANALAQEVKTERRLSFRSQVHTLQEQLAAKDAEINELSESIGFRNQELNQKDAEIAELKTKLNQKER